MRSLTPARVLLFGVFLTGALFLALFPIFPRQLRAQEGDIASHTIHSPRDETFESAILTEQAREAAARAVPDVLEIDPDVRVDQLATLAAATISIAQVRDNATLDDAAKRAQLLGVQSLAGLSRTSIDTVLALSEERWNRVAQEAGEVLERGLSEEIRPDEEAAHRDDLLAQISPDLSATEANFVDDLIRPLLVATLVVDEEATKLQQDTARQSVEPVQQSIARNQVIIEENRRFDATTLEVLEEVGLLTPVVEGDRLAAAGLIALLAALLLTIYLWLFPPQAVTSIRNLLLLTVLIAVPVLVAKLYFSLVLPDDERRFLAYFLPLAASPMLVATLLETRLAIVISMVQAALMSFAVVSLPDLSLVEAIQPLDAARVLTVYGLGGMIGVFAVHRAERTNHYLAGGVLVGGIALATLFALWLLEPDRQALDAAWMTAAAAASGLGSGLITAGSLTAVGMLFGITTRVQLMELSQLNAPLLRRMQDEASGTFHHSIIVGNLAERAADLVGADALLVRVGCYYHDIGKLLQPGYYVENQMAGDNPHDGMDPKVSARIIGQHVVAGQELARTHGLPARVRDFIPEHHGTRLIPYFYRLASQDNPNVDQAAFRYPGPRPQSRETAIVMMADSTEAMVRASADRSPERIDAIVEEIVAERLAEGELDECDLTLRDIRTIATSFKQTMRGVYHPRIEYPEPTARERRALIGRFRPGRRSAVQPPLPEVPPAPSQGRRST
ncbi:MAG: HDIG domain-containing protein [Chloroflexi bacterium]|nr:HDIG domain-containing protein [Chloroflexota bacterium]